MIHRLFLKILIGLFGVLLLTSCFHKSKIEKRAGESKKEFNVPISSGKSKYLYSVLVDKKTEKFVKEFLPNEQYDKSIFEEIRVYNEGVTPYYINPNKIVEHKESMFKDTTFEVLLKDIDKNTTVLLTTDFDRKKFLRVANNAIKRMQEIAYEKANKVKFDIDFKIESSIYTEYATATVLIHHRPSLQLNRTLFFINQSGMYANLISEEDISPILKKHIYKVGLPTGKNSVKVSVSSLDGKEVHQSKMVENIFKGKPTLHIVAIGINKFPNWYIGKSLKNAVSDANYLKEVFQKRSSKLFKGRVNIQPYSLDTQSTTKESITKIIEDVAKSVKPNDYFVLYVASHGIIKGQGENRKYYFAPSDFSSVTQNKMVVKNGFKENEISKYLMSIPSIFRLVILDTCYAGKEVNSIKEELKDLPFSKKNGISVLTAAKSIQLANDKYKGHGLFTYILVKGLNGEADSNKNGVVDSMEIAQYVKNNVGRISRSETNLIQDAMVIPEPSRSYTRRFDLTLLGTKRVEVSQPNIFTPKESQQYIDAINRKDKGRMNEIIRHNNHIDDDKIEPSEAIVNTQKEQLVKELVEELVEEGSIDINILFATNSDKLIDKEIVKLEEVAKALKSNTLKNKKIRIEGYTDRTGNKQFNKKLSERRANSVKKLLEKQFGINRNRLTSLGYGESNPLANNQTEEGRAQNRRVTIFVYE